MSELEMRVAPTSGMAVAGFVSALLFAPLGLVLSLLAMRETRTGVRGGHGLAVAGAVIGGLVTGGVLLLALLTTVIVHSR